MSTRTRIVVAGASGFLGRAVVEQLRLSGADVVGVSRRATPGALQVTSYDETPEADVIVHLAETNDRRKAAQQREATGVIDDAVVQALVRKAARVVYASSMVLYGDQDTHAHGTGDPVHVVDAYTEMKYAAETRVLERGGVAARLANIYGPGMPSTNVLSDILAQLAAEGPVKVMDASPVRDFVWLDDAAAALAAMALHSATGVFNVGTGIGTSIAQLARTVLEAAGQAGRPIESQRAARGRSHIVVDATRTTAVFGWRPVVGLSQGIATLVRHTSGRLQHEQA